MISSFSAERNKPHLQKLNPRRIGGIDLSNFSRQTCDAIYQRYFQSQQETADVVVVAQNGQEKLYVPSQLNKFIDDVIEAYQGNYDQIVADLDSIKWYAGIFGAARKEEQGKQPLDVHANDIIKDLIHTKITISNAQKRKELVEKANETKTIDNQPTIRANFQNPQEQAALTWLWEAGKIGRKTIKQKPVENTDNESINDWEKLKKRFIQNAFDKDQAIIKWGIAERIRNIFLNSDIAKSNLPVYYPGARGDIIIPLLFTDADNFVFVDFDYADDQGNLNPDALPDRLIKEYGGKIISIEQQGQLKKGGKRIVKYELMGKPRTIVCYAEDATKFNPAELSNGFSFGLIIAPSKTSETIGELYDVNYLSQLYQNLALGGFIHWKPTHILNPQTIGFREIIKPSSNEDIYGLYQKQQEVPQLNQIISFDTNLWICLNIPNGVYEGSISDKTLEVFEKELSNLRNSYANFPPQIQQEVVAVLKDRFDYEKMTEEEKQIFLRFGKQYGLEDAQKMAEYLEQIKNVISKVFPEIKQIYP
ncbi:MAG: hypothetical protein QHH09_02600 [Microgenomates group bacterium]|nr:hypothetical protein [Microgenomates group bacterium]